MYTGLNYTQRILSSSTSLEDALIVSTRIYPDENDTAILMKIIKINLTQKVPVMYYWVNE